MAATWELLRGTVDSYLARLTPEALQYVRSMQTGKLLPGDGGQGYMHPDIAARRAIEMLKNQLGLTEEQARQLANVSVQVYRNPSGVIPEDAWGMSEQGRLGLRSGYKSDEDYLNAIKSRMGLTGVDENPDATAAAAAAEQNAILGRRNAINRELDKFYSMLVTPVVNPDGTTSDPIAKQLIASGQNVAQREAAARGIRGPIGGTAAMASAQTALQPYLSDRLKMAQQGLQNIVERDNVEEDQRLRADQLALQAQGMMNDNAATAYNAKVKQGQGVGTMIGTAVGALGYAIPGAGAAVGPLTMAGGGALGGFIGGAAAGQGSGPTLSTPRFTNTSYRPGKGNY